MRESLACTARPGVRRARWAAEHPWCEGLPSVWRDQVVAPLDLEVHHDPELAARRAIGRDADGVPCYYAHRWILSEPCSDDDEEFYLLPAAGESVTAWRLCDERWLVRRVVLGNDRCSSSQPFFVFSATMPR